MPFWLFFGAQSLQTLSAGRRWLLGSLVALVIGTNLFQVMPLTILRHTPLQEAQWSTAGIEGRFLEPGNIGYSFARGEVKALIGMQAGFPLADYVRSIAAPPTGSMDCIVDYLRKNARPSDRVKIAYGDMPLMFHTPLAVTSSTEIGPPAPEWIIPRHFSSLTVDQAFMDSLARHQYHQVNLPFPDLQWNNQPDPLYHYYQTPATTDNLAPEIMLLKRGE